MFKCPSCNQLWKEKESFSWNSTSNNVFLRPISPMPIPPSPNQNFDKQIQSIKICSKCSEKILPTVKF